MFLHLKPEETYCGSVALLLGKKIGNPEVSSELLASAILWQCVAPLLWEDPGCGVSSVLCRRKLHFPFKQDAMQDLLSGCHDTLGPFSGEGEMHLH